MISKLPTFFYCFCSIILLLSFQQSSCFHFHSQIQHTQVNKIQQQQQRQHVSFTTTTTTTISGSGGSHIQSTSLFSSTTAVASPGSLTLTSRILNGVKIKFPDSSKRVVDCFERFSRGEEIDVLMGDGKSAHNRQRANCYVTGLTTLPFHDITNGKFQWALDLERDGAMEIAKELNAFLTKTSDNNNNNNNNVNGKTSDNESKWLGPRFVGQHYGPEWKTLGLQDRGVWDGENVESFPKTVELLSKLKVPSCEAFFARQGPHSGIQFSYCALSVCVCVCV